MTDINKLGELLQDVLLLAPGEFHAELHRDEVDTWDSLAVVALATGVEESFGYHMSESEAVAIACVADLIKLLTARGVFVAA